MLYFENDYSEGAHPKLLQRLMDTNMEHLSGYGSDTYTLSAKEKIRELCGCPEADVYFLAGGTQTNQTVIDSVLKSYEGVIAASTGHVSAHEAGAIEFTGHKVLTLPQKDGKITAEDLKDLIDTFYGDESHEPVSYTHLDVYKRQILSADFLSNPFQNIFLIIYTNQLYFCSG